MKRYTLQLYHGGYTLFVKEHVLFLPFVNRINRTVGVGYVVGVSSGVFRMYSNVVVDDTPSENNFSPDYIDYIKRPPNFPTLPVRHTTEREKIRVMSCACRQHDDAYSETSRRGWTTIAPFG